jgi:RNA polymerase sigma factor (sigma-70 family)
MARQTQDRRTNGEWVVALRGDLGRRVQDAAYRDLANYLYVVIYNYLCSRRDSIPRLYNISNEELADLAEEFTQDTLVKIALARVYNLYRGEGSFLAFMARVAINNVGQMLRRREWWVYVEPPPPPELEYEPESGDRLPPLPAELTTDPQSDTGLQLQEVWDTIRRCVEQLPERWRRAFILNVFEDRPVSEVKDQVNAPSENAVHILVSRARSRLKRCLADADWNLDDIWRLFS